MLCIYINFVCCLSGGGIFSTYDNSLAYPLRFKRARIVSNKIEFGLMTDSDAHLSIADCAGSDTPTKEMYELGKLAI